MKDLYLNRRIQDRISHKYIGIALTMMFVIFCSIHPLQAQQDDCYKSTRATAVNYMNKKDYTNAVKYFNLAKGCPDKPAKNDLDAKIKECEKLKAKVIKDKKDAEEKRRRDAEEARIREEQERLQHELEEERELRLAKRAYMQITNVRFINVDVNGNAITNSGILYWQDIKYMLPILEYDGLDNYDRNTTLYCKIIKPNGSTVTFSDSPSGYSYFINMTVKSGYDNEQRLTSWGSKDGGTFSEGTYTFEIYNEFRDKIDTRTFTVFDKPPTTVSVTFRVADKEAYLYVNNSYAGKGTAIMDLALGKTYTVEARKTSHTSQSVTVTASKSMNTTIDIPSPEPIYGSLSITASKNNVDVYVNDKFRGQAPVQLDQLLIGDYSVKMKKDKHYDFTQTVTVKANQRSIVNAEMQRIRHTPWLFRRPDNFASVFIEPVYAFDYGLNFNEWGSVGGHFTYCGSHLGFFAQYLHGIKSDNKSYSGGLVLRLTNDIIDLQLLGGVAYNSYTVVDYNYYNIYQKNAWMGNAGMRIGWISGGFSWWDIMGGVMFDGNHKTPYVGLGLGTTLTAALVGLGVYGANSTK